MICPRCSVAEISPDTNRCVLCGYTAGPAATVAVAEPAAEGETQVDAAAREELAPHFHIERPLDAGGFVSTFVAREADTERKVLLRVLPRQPVRDAGLEDRLLRELATAASLDHPHIIPVFRYGATGRYLWYSSKHVPGQSLAELLQTSGPLELHPLLRVVEQVASALQYAHRRGVVHADVRPANVRVDPNGWSLVTGFVVGRALDRLPLSVLGGRPVRRPEYLAPEERYSRQPGPPADQFSLAVLVYECLTGSLPFDGMTPDDVIPPALADPRPDLPEHVREALRRALSQRPGERFQSVLEFVSILEMDPTPRGSSARVTTPPAPIGIQPGDNPAAKPALMPPPRAVPPRRSVPLPGPTPGPAPGRAPSANPVLLVEQGSSWKTAIKWAAIVAGIILAGVFGPSWLERLRENRAPIVAAAEPAPDLDPALDPPPDTTLLPEQRPGAVLAPPPLDTQADTTTVAATTSQPTIPRPARPVREEPIRPPRTDPPPQRQTGPTPPPARLFVNSTPWGQLYIDGQLVGNTPQANLVVPAGSHRVRVVRDGFQPFERVVQLAPGQEFRLTDITLPETTP